MLETVILDELNNVTSGFFNGEDRKYDADAISSMFDGLITDGIFASIGDHFECVTGEDTNKLIVNVKTGKAWFDKTWISNNVIQNIKLKAAPSGASIIRIDAIVIDIDKRSDKRKNTIQYIPGEPALDPQKPKLVKDDYHKQYALCYIKVKNGITNSKDLELLQGDPVNYVTGPVSTIDSKPVLEEWKKNFQSLYDDQEKKLKVELKELGEASAASIDAQITAWKAGQEESFAAWFEALNTTLSANEAANLNTKLKREKINRLLQNGFEQCMKEISEDGKTITSRNLAGDSDPDSSIYYKIEKSFNDDFNKLTTTLSNNNNITIAIMTKTFDSTGSTIETTIDYIQV